tara:strand:- start:116 stop:733 length:618 start_codon:yes stop_codon:yes gene_type:complete
MKIYFDGDSWTHGGELDRERREELRYSRLVCEKLGAEETNLARGGASNPRIVRNLLINNDISQYDLAIIQMTYPERTEIFRERAKVWRTITIGDTPLHSWSLNLSWEKKKKDLEKKGFNHGFWTQYYKEVYNQTYGDTMEKIHFTTIKNHCAVNNVRLILLTNNNLFAKMKFDMGLEFPRYPKTAGGHPTAEGHKIIADDLLRLI